MKVSVVIVNYNQKDLLEKCIKSVKAMQYEGVFDIIVVDNQSSDNSVAFLQEEHADVHLITMTYNSGFCKGCNVGIEEARKRKSDAVLLLNNDTEVEKEFLAELVEGLSCGADVGMVAGKIFALPGGDTIDTAGIVITPDGLGKTRGYGERDVHNKKWNSVFCPSGSGGLFLMEMLEDIQQDGQYFDEDYKFYVEELDLAWRARLQGWECAYADTARAYHKRSSTSKKYPELRIFHANRNVYYNIIKNYPSTWYVSKALVLAFMKYPILLTAALFRKGVVVELSKDISIIKLVYLYCKGMVQVMWMAPTLLKKRRTIQARKKISPAQVRTLFERQGLSFWEAIFKL